MMMMMREDWMWEKIEGGERGVKGMGGGINDVRERHDKQNKKKNTTAD